MHSDKDVLTSMAKTHKVLVEWMQQQAHTSDVRAERSARYMHAHYLLFVQFRESLMETGLAAHLAEEATAIASMPFAKQPAA
jgi:hypothetical protein